MVLGHIQVAANEGNNVSSVNNISCRLTPRLLISGIWTKHLKTKTELHQTVIDRCLKSLVQKQLIKVVKNVKVSPM